MFSLTTIQPSSNIDTVLWLWEKDKFATRKRNFGTKEWKKLPKATFESDRNNFYYKFASVVSYSAFEIM